ncbi:hypothetical protein JOF53_006838 [Crossiella equi]|uniref:Uncharacterized protein n=1 Tax=Crossiella equi TaxID=130796 RepID=A0ABS5ANI2_9PSEU|nr:hypothetical protein [Crossiella equi]MBP2477966.1 hypothetical protein [Crossiella equi]
MRNRPLRTALLLPVAVAALAACSPAAPPPSQVASLSTPDSPTPSSGSVTPSGESERPQLRLDSSDEDVRRAWVPYNLCLKQNGHRMLEKRGDGTSPDQHDESPTGKAARQKCATRLPLQPPELDKKNPDFPDRYRAYIQCMDQRGLKVVPIEPFGSGWNYADTPSTLSPDQKTKVEKDCKIEAFSAR